MKVLLDCPVPFQLAHGGAQIQIEQTKKALAAIGVDVDWLRWWDADQKGDVIHSFSRMPAALIRFAHQKGIKVVIAELLTAQGSRAEWQHWMHKTVVRLADKIVPGGVSSKFGWDSYQLADACVALTPWEARLMHTLFGASREKIHVVPNGVEEEFFKVSNSERCQWLVCTATITPRKRVVELAEAAVRARTPIWIVGKPYAESDPYHGRFMKIANANRDLVRFEGPVNDRVRLAEIYREARGFVLLSTMESLSLSALEAAACECPLLLSDLPWARVTFADAASYCPITRDVPSTAKSLRAFYDAAPTLPPPPKPKTWIEVARQLKGIYGELFSC